MFSSLESTKVRIFCSYAYEDQKLQTKLEKQLKSLERRNQVFIWNTHKVKPGQRRRSEIDEQINRADLILLLISPDFIASDDCYAVQLNKALQRQTDGKTRIVPILLRPCNWQNLRFSEYQVIPRNLTPVTRWTQGQDAAFQQIVEEIDVIVQEILQHGPGCIEPLRVKQPSTKIEEQRSAYLKPRSPLIKESNITKRKSGSRTRKGRTLGAEESISSTITYRKALPERRSLSSLESLAKFIAQFMSIRKKAFAVICLIDVLLIPTIISIWLTNRFSMNSLTYFIVSLLILIAISSLMLIICPITNSRGVVKLTVMFFTASWAVSGWVLSWLIAMILNWIKVRGTYVDTIPQTNYAISIILAATCLIISFSMHLVIAFESNFLITNSSRQGRPNRAIK